MATKANIVIDQGSTFSVTFDLTDENGDPLNLVGYTANAQLRKHYSSTNSVVFTCTSSGANGNVTLSLTANQTNTIIAGRYVYDVELTENVSNNVSRIVEGIVTVTPQVTR
jgi:hypothetical protein